MNSVTAAYRDANKKSHSPVSSGKPTDIATAPTPYRIHNGPFTSPRLENFRCINVAAAVSNPQPTKEYIKNKKISNDPRITKVGKFLRRTSLDEFPQFINVLKGDMSLVGPRPYLLREVKDMNEYYYYIVKDKPGLTGPWQVAGRSNIDFEERLELDYKYVINKSLKKDFIILMKTIAAVFKKEGAI